MPPKKRLMHQGTLLLPASLPGLHALLTPAVAHAFDTLRVGAALREKEQWYAIHGPPHPVQEFEIAHGKERDAYNDRRLERAFRARNGARTPRGFCDFFGRLNGGTVHAVPVTGPFATQRPTSRDILERWHAITGRHGHPSIPSFRTTYRLR
jgi:hypothetical protein